ncbi:MAG: VWA domain-containing protein [Rikenellaceae bacterium]|nr:VWA domain-containing protein [Rikenellaceae bacterium]
MFRFANPHLLWLLALVPVMIVAFAVVLGLRRRNLSRFGNLATVKSLLRDVSSWRVHTKFILFVTAYTAVVFAAARPQFGAKLREEKSEGVEMMLVVDVSRSMMAEDFLPNRLDRTRYAIDKLFSSLNQDRVGVVVFAGEAKVQLPITSDYRMARSFAKRLSTDLVGVQGTELGEAIDLASLSFSDRDGASRVMVLITDGEAHDSGAVAAAERAAERGIRIFAIGIGSPEGAPIKIGGELIKDEKGEIVVSRLNEQLLQDIAEKGNGGYLRATNAAFGLDEIVDEIASMEKSERTTLNFEEYNEQFGWLLWIAVILLFVEFLLLDRRNYRLRSLHLFE